MLHLMKSSVYVRRLWKKVNGIVCMVTIFVLCAMLGVVAKTSVYKKCSILID